MHILKSFLQLRFLLSHFCLPLSICLILIFSGAHGEASERKSSRKAAVHKEEKRVPRDLIRIGHSNGHALLVEKKSQQLFIYDSRLSLVKKFNVTTGRRKGDKERNGDKKTPEGIYYFSEIKKDEALLPQYGVMAIVMNYPNVVDQRESNDGDGIWLHATDQPARAFKQFDTLGCVVALNKDVLEISKYIKLDMTPIIIEDEVSYISEASRINFEKHLKDLVYKWRDAWQNKDIEKYMALYSERFIFGNMNKKAYRAHKEKLNRRYDKIEVIVDNMSILIHREYTIVSFFQWYRSNMFKISGMKRLYFFPENDTFKIIGEEWRELDLKDPPPQLVRKEHPVTVTLPVKEPPAAVTLPVREKTQTGVNLETWVRSRNPSHYALQLLGVSSEDKIVSFINQHGLRGKAGFIKTIRDGKEWFVLIYGEYANMKEARSGVEALPDYLKNPSPWIRTFKSIQQSMDGD